MDGWITFASSWLCIAQLGFRKLRQSFRGFSCMSFATYSNINVQLRTLSDSGAVDGESRRSVLYGHGTGTLYCLAVC
jgi:hypothetical protein